LLALLGTYPILHISRIRVKANGGYIKNELLSRMWPACHAFETPHLEFLFLLAQQSISDLDRLIVEVCRSHTIALTHTQRDSSVPVTNSSQRPLRTYTIHKHPSPQQKSNPLPQQSSGRRPTS